MCGDKHQPANQVGLKVLFATPNKQMLTPLQSSSDYELDWLNRQQPSHSLADCVTVRAGILDDHMCRAIMRLVVFAGKEIASLY